MKGFIVDHTYRIEGGEPYVFLFGRLEDKTSFCCKHKFRPYFFVKKEDEDALDEFDVSVEKSDLKTFEGESVLKVYTRLPGDVKEIRDKLFEKDVNCFEADIRFSQRFLIDKKINSSIEIKGDFSEGDRYDKHFLEPDISPCDWRPQPEDFKILSVDIETSMDGENLYCISLVSNDDSLNKAIIVADKAYENSDSVSSEEELLTSFLDEVNDYDPDLIVGWNVIDFDLDYLRDKLYGYHIKFDMTRTKDPVSLRVYDNYLRDSKARVAGRSVLDGIHVLKNSFVKLEDYKLGTAAKHFLKEDKLIANDGKGETIEEYYESAKQKLINYNIKDSQLVLDILRESGTLQLTLLRSFLTGMKPHRVSASIASIDNIYLKRLRKEGFVAVTTKYERRGRRTTGGFVMNPEPGIYDFVVVMDFKSLYPSIMRTYNIDPLRFRPDCDGDDLIVAPNGACFTRQPGLIPKILGELYDERLDAKKAGDKTTSGAIKILMNSIYGVLASPNYRFYSFEMANAITSFGHELIKDTVSFVKNKGYETIYGDTDSLFINLDVKKVSDAKALSVKLEKEINTYFDKKVRQEYDLDSYLEIEYEKTFKKLLMPRTRGSKKGAKKRYAGLVEKNGEEDISFTGLEFVRRDWTELSKKFQMSLLWKVFKDEEVDDYIRNFVDLLKDGEFNDLLVYRKALRKNVEEYTKTTPPHVKAARKMDSIDNNVIEYMITVNGPEPVGDVSSSIDYDHYLDKQVRPIAESILPLMGKKFDDVLKGSKQTSLGNF